jgi:pimeloyl-ACP methyl ester carboxylesterase
MPYLTLHTAIKLFYTVHGASTNPPFLLIHGWACDSTDWSFTIPSLLQDYYTITLDLRGHGHSSAPANATYRINDFASDAVALLQHLGYTKDVLVMGHSMGGIVASSLSALYPEIFRGVVVIDPPYWRTTSFWKDMMPKWEEMQNGLAFVTEAFGNQMPPEDMLQPWMMVWYGMRMQAVDERVVGESLKGAFGEGMLGQREVHAGLVREMKCRRLAVYMREENVENEKGLGVEEGDEVVLVEGAGHWLHHVKPVEFNGILTAWLERLEGR